MINDHVVSLLLALLDGARFVNAMRRNGKPCRIPLPNDPEARGALVRDHVRGTSAMLTFLAEDREPWRERVDAVALAAFCPAADGRCRWVGIDLDADDHGERGLVDPARAMRTLAECAAAAGLRDGLLAARSRGGRGRHVFIMFPGPVALVDAVLGIAALAAAAFSFVAHGAESAEHPFRCANGMIARPGDAGRVELLPRSTARPPYGWALALPAAGAFRGNGGGVLVGPFDDKPSYPESIPQCDAAAWSRIVAEAGAKLSRRATTVALGCRRHPPYEASRCPLDRVDVRTRVFIDGQVPQGVRNNSAFAASANLLGCGVDAVEAERLILAGAAACGLPEREARAAFRSALMARARRDG